MRRTPGAIRRAELLRYDALAAERASVLKYDLALTFVMLIEHDARMEPAHQLGQLALAVLDRRAAQILAV